MIKDRGVIYVASRKLSFLGEAIASAETLKSKVPALPITLFTDIDDILDHEIPPFDEVLRIDPAIGDDTGLARGKLAKVWSLAQSPYQRTLFLDTDTRVLKDDIEDAFELLEEHSIAMVPCTPQDSRSCALYGPMFNSGVIAYRKDDKTSVLFARWEETLRRHVALAASDPPGDVPYLEHLDANARFFLLLTDQLSLAQLLSPVRNVLGLSVCVLENGWNARNRSEDDLDGVRIHHADCYKFDAERLETFLACRGMLGD